MQVVVSLHIIITTAAVLFPVLVILRLDLFFSFRSHSYFSSLFPNFNLLIPIAFRRVWNLNHARELGWWFWFRCSILCQTQKKAFFWWVNVCPYWTENWNLPQTFPGPLPHELSLRGQTQKISLQLNPNCVSIKNLVTLTTNSKKVV